jgi:hypothetical protein
MDILNGVISFVIGYMIMNGIMKLVAVFLSTKNYNGCKKCLVGPACNCRCEEYCKWLEKHNNLCRFFGSTFPF